MTRLPKSEIKLRRRVLPKPYLTFRFVAIGTDWIIDINQPLKPAAVKALLTDIKRRIDTFDGHYSRFRPDSLVAKMARSSGKFQLPADAKPLLNIYQQLYIETNGLMTPLVGQLLSDAGYDTVYSLHPSKLHKVPTWAEALDYDFPKLTIKRPVLLDFGAAGKGYLVDIISDLMQEAGIDSFCVNAGGDIVQRSSSNQLLDIGLEHPSDPDQAIGIAQIINQSLCGSAGNRRKWDKFHHIINPSTQVSPRHIRAVWVVADNALLADALSTCLFFVPPDKLLAGYTFKYAIINHDYSLQHSADFPATFFTSDAAD